ncbi:GFA family protein [Oceanomicrobium pacificus]|nr:GFA family protein [Oceanomicrobium pacificus]
MEIHEGGCLCGQVRFRTAGQPLRVTICHCRFCQKATGSAYMVEPIFNAGDLAITAGAPKTFDRVSEGSGQAVHVHFCARCGTKLWLSFDRFADVVGVYAGVFDDPCWFEISPATARHIFVDAAREDSVLPPGFPVYRQHAVTNDGAPCEATVHDGFHLVGRGGR